jgi:hypothetical protein
MRKLFMAAVLLAAIALAFAINYWYSMEQFDSFRTGGQPEIGEEFLISIASNPNASINLYDIQSGEKIVNHTMKNSDGSFAVFNVIVGRKYNIEVQTSRSTKSAVCQIGPNDEGNFVGDVIVDLSHDGQEIESIACSIVGFL